VLIEPSGKATVVGKNTAYFLQTTTLPEVCAPGKPLTLRNVNVYRIAATSGPALFELPRWRGTGGLAYSLDVVDGVVTSSRGEVY
jgi:hypothetical protein